MYTYFFVMDEWCSLTFPEKGQAKLLYLDIDEQVLKCQMSL